MSEYQTQKTNNGRLICGEKTNKQNIYICIATAVWSRVSINYKPWNECSFYFEITHPGPRRPSKLALTRTSRSVKLAHEKPEMRPEVYTICLHYKRKLLFRLKKNALSVWHQWQNLTINYFIYDSLIKLKHLMENLNRCC